jgi:hypothetical protein
MDTDSISNEGLGNVLKELQLRYKNLNKQRKVFYCQTTLKNIIDDSDELVSFYWLLNNIF